jgi:hypothetical protein
VAATCVVGRCRQRSSCSLERQRQIKDHGLRQASRCGARGMQLLTTAPGPAIAQACGGANAVADRMVGWVRLALLRDAAGARAARCLERRWQMEEHGLLGASRCGARGRRLLSVTAGPASPQACGGASAPADWMVGGVQLALLRDAGARAAAWSAGGRWRIMGYGGRAAAARAARGFY